MTDHVDPALIAAFSRDDLGDGTAALVAEHLDACPMCANRVRGADPMARLFASIDAPSVPVGLIGAILAADRETVRTPWTELAVAACLLSLAGALSWASVGLDAWWVRAGALLRALSTVADRIADDAATRPVLVTLALVAAGGVVFAGRPTRASLAELP